jgi:molybdopterin-guanine dinucleotide biosynthesis protein A
MDQGAMTGFVLAGGRSTRMGRDKAALSLNGRTLLETALSIVREVTGEVYILGPPELYGACAPAIADIFPGCGPLSGIHAALARTRTDFNLIIGVDTPFFSGGLLRYVAERALASRAVVTAPIVNSRPQPLCAVYSRAFLPVAEQALRRGAYKVATLFPQEGTVLIPETELARVAFVAEMFENLNTPDDLERARERSGNRAIGSSGDLKSSGFSDDPMARSKR